MHIVNLFCDASIDTNLKIACGGCHIMIQNQGQITHSYDKLYIQHNATNNSAEILAIWAGVVEAIKIRDTNPNHQIVFRLFSDSKISLYGCRDWMKNWIRNSHGEDELVSSSGTPVANQQTFIDIYNMIIAHQLKIEFYHQRGHVGETVRIQDARVYFIKTNKVSPENLGLDIHIISECNTMIDNATRNAMREYIKNNNTSITYGAQVYLPDPFIHVARYDELARYISLINKTSVYSRHNFNGGYTQ